MVKDSGTIKLFGKDYTDPGVRARVGALIENPGCFPDSSIYVNLKMQCLNLGIKNADEEIARVLKIVRMEEHSALKFKKCSLGMKQRVGIAMALLGSPALLILDEPINGLDADGMKLTREILVDVTQNYNCTVLISSHLLGELEKIATHYGIIRRGKMIQELSAEEMEARAKVFISFKIQEEEKALTLLKAKYKRVTKEEDCIRVYQEDVEEIVQYLLKKGLTPNEIKKNKIGLEEYYIQLMSSKEEE